MDSWVAVVAADARFHQVCPRSIVGNREGIGDFMDRTETPDTFQAVYRRIDFLLKKGRKL